MRTHWSDIASRLMWRPFPALLIIVAACLTLSAGQSGAAGARNDAGVLRGQVLDAVNGNPIAQAEVRLLAQVSRQGPGGPMIVPARSTGVGSRVATTRTDARGRFTFRGVDPGLYGVEAVASGYLTGYFGHSASSRLAIPVEVRAGVGIDDLQVNLLAPGVVSGRILSETGVGLPGLDVDLIGAPSSRDGVGASGALSVRTGDDGEFRVENVAPGDYYVRAYPKGLPPPSGPGPSRVYAPTFFPSATQLAAASVLAVASGQEVAGIDIRLAVIGVHAVRGRLVGADALPAINGRASLMPLSGVQTVADMQASLALQADVARDGRFELRNIQAGRYHLRVDGKFDAINWRGPIADQLITVDGELEDVDLVPRLPTSLEGRVRLADGTRPPVALDKLRVMTVKHWPGGYFTPSDISANVSADGRFAFMSAGGHVSLNVGSLPAGWLVEAIEVNGVAIADDDRVTLPPGSRVQLDVIVTNRASGLSGRVIDGRKRPVTNALVLIFPEDRARWGVDRWVFTAFSQSDGVYVLDTLPPGDFRAIAVNGLANGAWRSSEVLEQLWPLSTGIRLRREERESQELVQAAVPSTLR